MTKDQIQKVRDALVFASIPLDKSHAEAIAILDDAIKRDRTFESLRGLVEGWGRDRKIIPNSTASTQLLKAVSEIGELADAEIKGDAPAIVDAVGDVLVCLIMYCALRGIDITHCLSSAYGEIKDRRGTLMPNGVFVKE